MSNFTKLINLEEEIKRLTGQKGVLEGDLERIKKEKLGFQRKVDNEIKLLKQETNDELSGRRQELTKEGTKLVKREEQIILKEEEQKTLEQDWTKLREDRRKFSQEKKSTEEAKVNYLEKTHLAELRAKQLEKTIKELGGKTEEPKKVKKKK